MECHPDTSRSTLPLGLAVFAVLLFGALVGPRAATAQQTAELSFPLSVSTDAGGGQELLLGLDPAATAGIDTSLGESEQPPLPPSDIFDARLVDDDVPPSGFGEGLTSDFREGTSSFVGTKEHEIQIQPDSGATEVTIGWELPAGVSGTLTDVITDGGLVDAEMQGSGTHTFTNIDVTKLYVTISYTGTSNASPEATGDEYSMLQDSTLSITDPADGVLANDMDPDGDGLSASLVSAPSEGSLSLNSDGTFEYVPNSGFSGADSFVYEAADGNGGTDTASVALSIVPADGSPAVQVPVTVSTDDGDSQELSLGLAPGATIGIDPSFGESEQPPSPPSDIFDARLIDDDLPGSGMGEGLLTDIRSGSEDFTGTKQHEIQVQPGDGAGSVTVAWALPSGVTGRLQDVVTEGDILDEPMTGSGSFTFENLNVTALYVTLEYGPPNTPPNAAADNYTAPEGEVLQVDAAEGVLANDTDAEGDPLSASVVSGPSDGVLTLDSDGSFSYGPDAGFTGSDSFTYQVSDGRGGTAQATATIAVQPQQDAAVSVPLTVTADTMSTQLTLGLDPAASAGIDVGFGEQQQPPVPPSDAFDARLIDDDLSAVPDTAFGEGLLADIREGATDFVGTKVYQVQVQPGGAADEVTFAWTLPPGVDGTLEDVVTDGEQVSVPLSGSGSYTLTNLNITELYVTLEYALGNVPPTVATPLPNDTLQTPGPPLQVTGIEGVFTDPNDDPLAVAATSSDPGVVEVGSESSSPLLLQPGQAGSAQVSVTASDPDGASATDTFTVVVEDRPANQEVPDRQANAVVNMGDSTSVGFGDTGVGAAFQGVESDGVVEVRFYTDSTLGTPGAEQEVQPTDSFQNESRYRWDINNQGVTFETVNVAFGLDNPNVVGVGEPDSVTIIQDDEGGGFEPVPTVFVGGDTPASDDDALVAQGLTGLSTFKFASDDADNPLPVEITHFAARLNDGAALLQWRTASETNNSGFEVQHKGPDAGQYTEAGFVESKVDGGTSTEPTSYRFEVSELAAGTHRFRLRQVDIDGTGSPSKSVSVTVKMEETLRLMPPSPNPVRSNAQVRFGVQKAGEATVSLYNVLGQRVVRLYRDRPTPGEMQTVRLGSRQISDLPSGVYFVRLEAQGMVRTRRMVVVQ